MIFLWLALFTLYLLSAAVIVPKAQQKAYHAAPKDWQFWFGHILFYAVPFSWLWPHDDPTPLALLLALTLILYGGTLAIWAMVSNPYFSPAIVRPDTIIATGAYRLCNHPGYTGFAMLAVGTWLLIGAMWGLIPLAGYLGLLMWRSRRESEILAGLDTLQE